MSPAQEQILIEAAQRGMANAYAPLNNFPVGAAIQTRSGEVFEGCNVQSVISGMGVCAERCAIDHAVVSGHYCYDAVAVVSTLVEPIAPCGMCLQFLGEFAQVSGNDIEIIMVGAEGAVERSSVQQMAHRLFGPVDLGLDISKYRR